MSGDAERSGVGGAYSPSAGLLGNQTQDNIPPQIYGQEQQSKPCSVRGCAQLISVVSPNKMCEACRGRHRVYASTKRARRKLEKAAVASVVRARNRKSSPSLTNTIANSERPGNGTPINDRLGGSDMPQVSVSIQSASTTSTRWEDAIDPRLFATSASASSTKPLHSPYHHSSSELANALTLPTSNTDDKVPDTQEQEENAEQVEVASMVQNYELDSGNPEEHTSTMLGSNVTNLHHGMSSDAGHRPCSVKGCRTSVLDSYEFKMCPPCRTRYRTYGTTKRAKWKAEREAFEHEIAGLQALEDERRKQKGLPPLSESPEELHAWELAVIDEQVLILPSIAAAVANTSLSSDSLRSGTPPMHSLTSIDLQQMESPLSSTLQTPNLDTQLSTSTLQNSNQSLMGQPPPMPARTCTVSHCHKILPDSYRYKRCEQHRVQTRQHSKLKRDREQDVKTPKQFNQHSNIDGHCEGIEYIEISDQIDGQGKEKAMEENTQKNQDAKQVIFVTNHDDPAEIKKRRHICSTQECQNLLAMGFRWRMCETCRANRRSRNREMKKMEAGVKPRNLDNGVPQTTFIDNDQNSDSQEDADGEEDPDIEIQTDEENKHPKHTTLVSTATTVLVNQPSSSPLTSTKIYSPTTYKRYAFHAYQQNSTNSELGKAEGRPAEETSTNPVHLNSNGGNESKSHSLKEKAPINDVLVTLPTPTIPTSTPFVYNPYAKKQRTDIGMNPVSIDTNGPYQFTWRSTPVAPIPVKPKNQGHSTPTASPASLQNSAPSNLYPYPFPSHPQYPYPYYAYAPYGMAPYVIPAPPDTNQRTSSSTSSSSLPTASVAPTAPTALPYLSYPYMHPYGYPLSAMGPHSPGYYMTPQYSSNPYGPPTSGYPPHAPPGTYISPYGLQVPTTASPISATMPSTNEAATSTLGLPTPSSSTYQNPSVIPPFQVIPQFSYYHHDDGHSSSVTAPIEAKKKRRRTVFPVTNKISQVASADIISHKPPVATLITMPRIEMTSINSPASTPSASAAAESRLSGNEEAKEDEYERKQSSPHTRECANKSCHRFITAVGFGTICDKCRTRFKKHQAKAKQRFKLEPRRSSHRGLTSVGNVNGGPPKE